MQIETKMSLDWFGSVGWVSSCKAKCDWFDSDQDTCLSGQSGPRLGHMQEATDPCFSYTLVFLSLSFSLPSPFSKNN